ncbi:TPA: hypothetical protein DCP77_03270 [Candidatus Collierbacteria bacterium]|nr:MAG: glycosyl transferase family 39 [Candidatus Collierbacteria bacterium GW2011_GWF2_42_51]HAN22776.1 hypothetical protein [Candidatus Collierbacteria bacterium]HAS69159.1 hypothetical protein [Candidatus Collierbacteria bacterium]HCW31664.1 hypothetical protein [Candidatus Collierbacteria bacterium]
MVKKITTKFFLPLIILGILLQLFISVTTYHPDLRAFVLASKFIGRGEVLTFYDHVAKLPQGDLVKKIYNDDIFIYPPLAYLIPAAIQVPFMGVMAKAVDIITLDDNALFQGYFAYLPLLIFKLPFLLFGFLTLIYLPKLFKNKEQGRLSQLIWLFAPVTIHVAAGIGQVDTILTFFLLLALIFLKKGSYAWGSVFVALSALIKPFGLAILPLIAIKVFKEKGFKKALLAILPGVAVWLAFILPYMGSPAFKMYALLASLAEKSTFAGIAISGGTVIPWLYVVYILIAIYLYSGKLSLIHSIGLTILSTLAFNHFHPQWFLWFMPWLLYYSITSGRHYLWIMLILFWTVIWLSFDPSQSIGMFLSLKDTFTPTTINPIQNSSLILFARAGLVASLISLLYDRNIQD